MYVFEFPVICNHRESSLLNPISAILIFAILIGDETGVWDLGKGALKGHLL